MGRMNPIIFHDAMTLFNENPFEQGLRLIIQICFNQYSQMYVFSTWGYPTLLRRFCGFMAKNLGNVSPDLIVTFRLSPIDLGVKPGRRPKAWQRWTFFRNFFVGIFFCRFFFEGLWQLRIFGFICCVSFPSLVI